MVTTDRFVRYFTALTISLTIFCGLVSPGQAFNTSAELWKRQSSGISCILDSWRNGKSNKSYELCFRDIITAETSLLACEVAPNDKRLISRYADDGSGNRTINLPRFAYQIFIHRLNEDIGWHPQSGRVFNGHTYELVNREDSTIFFAINFDW